MNLEIQFKDGSMKYAKPTDAFEYKTELTGLLIDENKVHPIKSFNLTDGMGRTLASGVFSLTGNLMMSEMASPKGARHGR